MSITLLRIARPSMRVMKLMTEVTAPLNASDAALPELTSGATTPVSFRTAPGPSRSSTRPVPSSQSPHTEYRRKFGLEIYEPRVQLLTGRAYEVTCNISRSARTLANCGIPRVFFGTERLILCKGAVV